MNGINDRNWQIACYLFFGQKKGPTGETVGLS